MAAEIIEEVAPDEGTDDLPTSEEVPTEQLITEFAPADTTADPTPEADDLEALPDKYKGKSIRGDVYRGTGPRPSPRRHHRRPS